MWEIYDELIEGIDEGLVVEDFLMGSCWTMVKTEAACGIALAIKDRARDREYTKPIEGARLKDIAACAKSWNFSEASLGMAAINCYYNDPARVRRLGLIPESGESSKDKDAFVEFAGEVTGKNVCVIGHFPNIERQLAGICNLSVLERSQNKGDYPDSACEYLLPEQDVVFITGMTFMNKTLPRLLQIAPPSTKIALVGPSVPASASLFSHNVDNLSCFTVQQPALLYRLLKEGTRFVFDAGMMISYDKPQEA